MMLLLKVEKRNYQKGELNGPAAISWPRCYHYSDDSGAVHGGVHGVNMYFDGYQLFFSGDSFEFNYSNGKMEVLSNLTICSAFAEKNDIN